VGGTGNVLGGGKFVNGAATTVFALAFEEVAGKMIQDNSVYARESKITSSLSSPDDPFSDLSPLIKASAALDVVKETCPASYACDVPSGFTIKNMGEDRAASTNIYTGELIFNSTLFDFSEPYTASSLLDSAYHETMHRGSSFFTRWVDGNSEGFFGYITENHQMIYDRSSQLTRDNIQFYYDKLKDYRGGK
jgi:hypothetical protein